VEYIYRVYSRWNWLENKTYTINRCVYNRILASHSA
jgi:hypothetical protein